MIKTSDWLCTPLITLSRLCSAKTNIIHATQEAFLLARQPSGYLKDVHKIKKMGGEKDEIQKNTCWGTTIHIFKRSYDFLGLYNFNIHFVSN